MQGTGVLGWVTNTDFKELALPLDTLTVAAGDTVNIDAWVTQEGLKGPLDSIGNDAAQVSRPDSTVWDPEDPVPMLAYHRYVILEDPTALADRSTPQVNGRLHQNCPNPFGARTIMAFDLPRETDVSLSVYDVAGHLVDVLINAERATQGRNEVAWHARDTRGRSIPAGVYFYRLEAEVPSKGVEMS